MSLHHYLLPDHEPSLLVMDYHRFYYRGGFLVLKRTTTAKSSKRSTIRILLLVIILLGIGLAGAVTVVLITLTGASGVIMQQELNALGTLVCCTDGQTRLVLTHDCTEK